MKIVAFTPGFKIPSARFRLRQHIDYLASRGIIVKECYARKSSYPPAEKSNRFGWAVETAFERFMQVIMSRSYDLTFFQREMISTLCTFEPFTKGPRVFDVDDAIWINGRVSAKLISKCCDVVICGNNYIAERFLKWKRNVVVLPTAVDTKRFEPSKHRDSKNGKTIVWSGTSSGFHYLYSIEKALSAVINDRTKTVLRVIADKKPKFNFLDPGRVVYIPWSAKSEVEAIRSADIGIMPLADNAWERGKCSYKMLLYMACALPVVVTPIGMNKEVLCLDSVGLAADNNRQWAESLNAYLEDPDRSYADGLRGRKVVERYFSCKVLAPRLAELLLSLG